MFDLPGATVLRKEGKAWVRKEYLEPHDLAILQGLSQQAMAWMSQQQDLDDLKRDKMSNLTLVTTLAGAKDLNAKRDTKA